MESLLYDNLYHSELKMSLTARSGVNWFKIPKSFDLHWLYTKNLIINLADKCYKKTEKASLSGHNFIVITHKSYN